jgi:pyrroloquinoline quinone (PQQ) biosynthesis protein C
MKVLSANEVFQEVINELYEQYLPSKHPFFERLVVLPPAKLNSSTFLGELYLRYQSACHATRVMVYYLPDLDHPTQRVRKLRVISDDDGGIRGDTHHYQLSNAFRRMGAVCTVKDEDFGDIAQLSKFVDPKTANFLFLVKNLYPKSLGPWCIVEGFADDWMRALMKGLSNQFPFIRNEPYFSECLSQGVEERHAKESLDLTREVLTQNPHRLKDTVEGARLMAMGLTRFWDSLYELTSE